jgi:hypothetical protein
MKIYRLLLILSVMVFAACEDFLTEVNTIQKSQDLVYSTPASLENLVATCYSYNRLWYGKEAGFTMSEGGTDLWYNCKDNKESLPFSTYNGLSAGSYTTFPFDQYWEGFYSGINLCNTAESYIEANTELDANKKMTLLSEVKFLRAFYYWHLVETWGPVPLHIKPITVPSLSVERNSVDEIYNQMFLDVQFGIDHLTPSAPSSRVTYWAAKAFKARLALYYASEYGHSEYYTIAATEAKDVIAGSGKVLYANYADVWRMSNEAIANNSEFIWGVDYYNTIGATTPFNSLPSRAGIGSDGKTSPAWSGLIIRQPQATAGAGNCQHLWVTPLWHGQNTSTGGASLADILPRWGGTNSTFYTIASPTTKVVVPIGYYYVPYSLGYVRYAPTRYLLDLYDETIDQRWDVSFRSVWYKHPNIAPRNYGSGSCAYPLMSMGTDTDTAMYYSKRALTSAQRSWAAGRYKVFDITNCFGPDGATNTTTATDGGAQMYIAMRKFENTSSTISFTANSNFNDYFSGRDFPIFRLSEMYLIVAEAELTSNNTEALQYINDLRFVRAITGHTAEMQLATVDIDAILKERALEFCGENIRWFDLKRTGKLATQILYNKNASPYFDSHHYLRPISGQEYSLIENKSDTPGVGFWQNPGY